MEELKKILEESVDKVEILKNIELLTKHEATIGDVINLVNEYLDDNGKVDIYNNSTFADKLKNKILESISSEELQVELIIKNIEKFKSYEIVAIMDKLGNEAKLKFVKDEKALGSLDDYTKAEILTKIDDQEKIAMLSEGIIPTAIAKKMIKSMQNDAKLEILSNTKICVEVLKMSTYDVVDGIETLDDGEKLEIINKYKASSPEKAKVIAGLKDENIKIDLMQRSELSKTGILDVAKTLDTQGIIALCCEHRKFIDEYGIKPYQIVSRLPEEKQGNIVAKMELLNISELESKQIFLSLNDQTKKMIDKETIDPKYLEIMDIKYRGYIKDDEGYNIEFGEGFDISKLRGLDEMIRVNPLKFDDSQKESLLELCKVCPELIVKGDVSFAESKGYEYAQGEKWIDEIIEKIDSNWSSVEKLAYIDRCIGKKVSYSADFETEVFDQGDSRALWKIITTGQGICNGVAEVEEYVLKKIGIDSEQVSSGSHAFLRIKNLEVPGENGETIVTDTIVDPTWNLTNNKFGVKPNCFCKSYEDIRKLDSPVAGFDRRCHQNDEKLSDVTYTLQEEHLRQAYKNIGELNSEDKFFIADLLEKDNEIKSNTNLSGKEIVARKLKAIQEYRPDFAEFQNSAIGITGDLLYTQDNKYQYHVEKVYQRDDEQKSAVMYVYANLRDEEDCVFVPDAETGEFVEMNVKDFEEKFECYDTHLEKYGKRPWDKFKEQEIEQEVR